MQDLIRLAQPADLAHLAAIERAAGAMFPAERLPDPDHTHAAEDLQRALTQKLLWVAADNSRPAGFAVASLLMPYLHLDELSVHPDYGRRGIGSALVHAVIADARQRSLQGVTLTTFADFAWNGPFYTRLGFNTLTTPPDHIRTILAAETAAGMTHRIGMLLQTGKLP